MDREYGYTNQQIEARATAPCNLNRLKEHRQCAYCHLCFDCIVYKDRTGINLCEYVDKYTEEE